MKNAMRSLEDFDTFEEVPTSGVSFDIISATLTVLWVHVWKGFVKSRLCTRGYKQAVSDLDDTYAYTPVVYIFSIV